MTKYDINNRPELLQPDDVVIFKTHRELIYKVSISCLLCNYGNDSIFTDLKISNKYDFAFKSYGYITKNGSWPSAYESDYKALTQLVLDLYNFIDGTNAVPRPASASKELKEEYTLKDKVIFTLWGKTYEYYVNSSFLSHGLDNRRIFKQMGLSLDDTIKWATLCYGYKPLYGGEDSSWPEYKANDFKALTIFVKDIQRVTILLNTWYGYKYNNNELQAIIFSDMFRKAQPNSEIITLNTNFNSLNDGQIIKTSRITPTIRIGEKRSGCIIRGKASRTATQVGHLSNTKIVG